MLGKPIGLLHRMVWLLLPLGFALAGSPVLAADIYDAAVQHAGRSAEDIKRDASDRPADMLRLAGIKPGMQVADILAGDGYYSELLSYVVGPKGHVALINNAGFDGFTDDAWKKRLAGNRLPNVEHRTVEMDKMDLGDGKLDAVVMIKIYHDLYWVSVKDGWPKIDTAAVLDQISHALKPGGVLLVVDHSAKPGVGSTVAGELHRIDEAFARKDFEAHGFKMVGTSNLLRKPDDKRDQVSYKPPMLGNTDRFVLVFRKTGS